MMKFTIKCKHKHDVFSYFNIIDLNLNTHIFYYNASVFLYQAAYILMFRKNKKSYVTFKYAFYKKETTKTES